MFSKTIVFILGILTFAVCPTILVLEVRYFISKIDECNGIFNSLLKAWGFPTLFLGWILICWVNYFEKLGWFRDHFTPVFSEFEWWGYPFFVAVALPFMPLVLLLLAIFSMDGGFAKSGGIGAIISCSVTFLFFVIVTYIVINAAGSSYESPSDGNSEPIWDGRSDDDSGGEPETKREVEAWRMNGMMRENLKVSSDGERYYDPEDEAWHRIKK